MTQTQHTPTPFEDSGNVEIIKIKNVVTLEPIAFLKPGYPQNKANAEFIVRACNSFDDMLEACEWAYKVLSENLDRRQDAMSVLQAAIKKARGEV